MNLYTANPLQAAIIDRCTDEHMTDEETRDAIRDMASGHDPIYQFVGHIATDGMVTDIYDEFKADVTEAIAELASYADYPHERAARDVITWRWGAGQAYQVIPTTHADFAAACLVVAITYHAGELASQLDAE